MRAVVFAMLPDGSVTADPFEGDGCLDQAHAFRASIEPDWPGGIFAVGADEEAAEDRKNLMMQRLGLRSGDPDD